MKRIGDKSKLPDYKSQISSKLQFQITKTHFPLISILAIGIYLVLGVWDWVLYIKLCPL